MSEDDHLLGLNKYLQQYIIHILPWRDIGRLSQVSTYYDTLIKDMDYWKNNTSLNIASKRILRELRDIMRDPPVNISAGPLDDNNLYHWNATMLGPDGTPYSGGVFFLELDFPNNYPFNPVKIKFTTKILHVNVNDKGAISMHMLCCDWNPAFTASKCLLAIFALLEEPNPDSEIFNVELAALYKRDKQQYEKNICEWVKKYAI